MREIKEGQLSVWWAREVPIKNIVNYFVEDIESALGRIDKLAERDLSNPRITDNVGGLQIFKNGEWEEWEDEEGNSIDDISRMEADEQEKYLENLKKGVKEK